MASRRHLHHRSSRLAPSRSCDRRAPAACREGACVLHSHTDNTPPARLGRAAAAALRRPHAGIGWLEVLQFEAASVWTAQRPAACGWFRDALRASDLGGPWGGQRRGRHSWLPPAQVNSEATMGVAWLRSEHSRSPTKH
jgi:hypothetical protein